MGWIQLRERYMCNVADVRRQNPDDMAHTEGAMTASGFRLQTTQIRRPLLRALRPAPCDIRLKTPYVRLHHILSIFMYVIIYHIMRYTSKFVVGCVDKLN